ncbi:MAG: NfeD family protein [Clostridia bacterium]|nr:NfeD family protein [Clostridia bacterium]
MMFWIWLAIAVAFLFIEIMTSDLVSIWFAASALVMVLISAVFPDLHVGWQVGIFVVLSAVLFVATRKLVKKFFKRNKDQETNLELIVGHEAVVTKAIDNLKEEGEIKLGGLYWTARSADETPIEEGAVVLVEKLRGNKAIVKKINKE